MLTSVNDDLGDVSGFRRPEDGSELGKVRSCADDVKELDRRHVRVGCCEMQRAVLATRMYREQLRHGDGDPASC